MPHILGGISAKGWVSIAAVIASQAVGFSESATKVWVQRKMPRMPTRYSRYDYEFHFAGLQVENHRFRIIVERKCYA